MSTPAALRPVRGPAAFALSLLVSVATLLAPVPAAVADDAPPSSGVPTVRADRGPSAQALTTRAALKVARRQIGDRYTYGGAGPDAFDCSGLIQFSYLRAGQSVPRTSGEQAKASKRVPKSEARRGDLAFFYDRDGVYHVAFYLGENRLLHAPGTGQRVGIAEIWTTRMFFGRVR